MLQLNPPRLSPADGRWLVALAVQVSCILNAGRNRTPEQFDLSLELRGPRGEGLIPGSAAPRGSSASREPRGSIGHDGSA